MVQSPQTRASERNIQSRRSTGEDVAQDDQGAMGLLERAGDAIADRIGEIYSAQNMERAFAKMDRDLPGFGTLLKEIFNAISGAMSGDAPAANMSDDISAAVYGSADPKSDGARMAANFLQRGDDLAAIASIGSGTGGAIMEVNGIQFGRDGKPEDDQEDIEEFADGVERAAAERERMWDSQKHSVAGMDLTGEEIDGMIEMLNDPAARQKIIERRAKEKGISKQQAERDVDNAERLLKLTKLRDTGKLTPEQEAEWQRLNNDRNTRETTTTIKKVSSERELGSETRESKASQTDKAAAVESRADLLDQPFSSAPPLQEKFAEAKAATVPLDAAKPAQPTVVASLDKAAPPPQQVTSAGFDV